MPFTPYIHTSKSTKSIFASSSVIVDNQTRHLTAGIKAIAYALAGVGVAMWLMLHLGFKVQQWAWFQYDWHVNGHFPEIIATCQFT